MQLILSSLFSSFSSIDFDFDNTFFSKSNSGSVGTDNNEWNSRGLITHYTYGEYRQNFSLNENRRDSTVNNRQINPLPCPLSGGGCNSISADPFPFTWD